MTSDIEKRLAAVEAAVEDLRRQRAEEYARTRRLSWIRIGALIVLAAIYYFYVSQSLSGM